MNDTHFTLDSLVDETLQSTLLSQISQCSNRQSRSCGAFSDQQFFKACLDRVISQDQSGREFLQAHEEIREQRIPRSTFFGALNSRRRLDFIEEVVRCHYEFLGQYLSLAGIDYLEEFGEIADYEVLSADGHYIEHACHEQRSPDGRVFAAGNLYVLNMRNGLIRLLTHISGSSTRKHELPPFRNAVEKSRHRRQTIWLADRAFIDFRWWERQARKGNYVISRAKSNKSVLYCGQFPFDRNDPVNAGVINDRTGAFTSNGWPIRIIDYVDPETGEEMTFYTTLKKHIRPGIICWLYFLRWRIEKSFDCFKNSLGERKAWATGKNAAQIQGHAISAIYNFIQYLSAVVQKETGCSDDKSQKNYQRNLQKRAVKAKGRGGFIHPLLTISRRICRISSQFIRAVRNHFFSEKPLGDILPLFILRLRVYL